MQQRTRQQQSLKAFFEERRDLLSPLSQKKGPKKGKKKTTNDTLNNSWTLGRHLFLVSPPKRQKSRLLILLRSAHARKRLSPPPSLSSKTSHRIGRDEGESKRRREKTDSRERERSRGGGGRLVRVHCAEPKFLGEIKFACVLGATKKRRQEEGATS